MAGFILPSNHLSERSLCCLRQLHNQASGLRYYVPYDLLILDIVRCVISEKLTSGAIPVSLM